FNHSPEERELHARTSYEAVYADLVTLAKADPSQWMNLEAWIVAWDYIELVRSHMTPHTPWSTVWWRVRKAIEQKATVADFDRCRREIMQNLVRLRARAERQSADSALAGGSVSSEAHAHGEQAEPGGQGEAGDGSGKEPQPTEERTKPSRKEANLLVREY